jgi:hypothetical protein
MTGQHITDAALNHARGLLAPMYRDTCIRMVYTAGSAGYGHSAVYTAGASLPCLFVPVPQPDLQGAAEVPLTVGTLYLARASTLQPNDRVKITHLHGEALASPQTYDIVAGPVVDHTTMQATLRLVTDGG